MLIEHATHGLQLCQLCRTKGSLAQFVILTLGCLVPRVKVDLVICTAGF